MHREKPMCGHALRGWCACQCPQRFGENTGSSKGLPDSESSSDLLHCRKTKILAATPQWSNKYRLNVSPLSCKSSHTTYFPSLPSRNTKVAVCRERLLQSIKSFDEECRRAWCVREPGETCVSYAPYVACRLGRGKKPIAESETSPYPLVFPNLAELRRNAR